MLRAASYVSVSVLMPALQRRHLHGRGGRAKGVVAASGDHELSGDRHVTKGSHRRCPDRSRYRRARAARRAGRLRGRVTGPALRRAVQGRASRGSSGLARAWVPTQACPGTSSATVTCALSCDCGARILVYAVNKPAGWCQSTTSPSSGGRSDPNAGMARHPPTARAACRACVTPGLPGASDQAVRSAAQGQGRSACRGAPLPARGRCCRGREAHRGHGPGPGGAHAMPLSAVPSWANCSVSRPSVPSACAASR